MSEYSISSPGQELTVEYLPSGVVYAATEDLPGRKIGRNWLVPTAALAG